MVSIATIGPEGSHAWQAARRYNPAATIKLFPNLTAVFKAFAAQIPDRSFGPNLSYSAPYNIYLSGMGKVATINYAVDASYPGRAKEPYLITYPNMNGVLDSYGVNEVTLSVVVNAAGDDVDEVVLDASPLGLSSAIALTQIDAETWQTKFKNTELKPAGEYNCWIKASTSSSAQYLYMYFLIIIVQGTAPVSLSDDVQPLYNSYCISCHQSVSPPLDLDLSAGNAWSNTVEVDSVQCTTKRIKPFFVFQSYVIAKVLGVHAFPPFNGSGDRMPKNGPPYLTDPEIQVINTWIEQGAQDN